jgi:23S rRNA (pseudouridine1915-N3)-methyltransferase
LTITPNGIYIKFDLEVIPDIKNVTSESQQREGEQVLAKISKLILLNENGKTFSV